ncbi:MAG: group 1 truncated hemoglobin [Nitrospirae bacterium]|nr:group 1 truncated hemoglobin [Nitrospirota bacterium]
MKKHRYLYVAVIFALVAASGCAAPTIMPTPSLYDRLGGKEAIAAVVNDFMELVGEDTRIQHAPVPERIPAIKTLLADMVCQASGGPCTYGGRDMKSAHAGMGITNAEFDAVVDDLVKTLDKYKVGEKEKNELLSLLAPMRSDIVEVK